MYAYPALKLYPYREPNARERIYITDSVQTRLRYIRRYIKDGNISRRELARRIECNDTTINRLVKSEYEYPALTTYLALMKYFGFDLSRDVNYCYAMVFYPPEEIKYRARRIIFPRARKCGRWSGCVNISEATGDAAQNVSSAMNYSRNREVSVYARTMLYISRQERLRGYDNAMIFED